MPKVDLEAIEQTNRTGYPAPFSDAVTGRWYRRVAPATGITDFGISHVVLKPGAQSSQRHWHAGEDELVVMLSGEAILVEDGERTVMRAGDIATFPKAVANGHMLVNESREDCVFVAVGKPSQSECHYSDVDLHLPAGRGYTRKDGTPY